MVHAGLDIPVVFLVFNRPEHTARVFERIREARPTKLFVVADGPRLDRPGEARRCADVRQIVEEGVDWPCEVIRDYSETNLGCARRVSSGVTNAFKQVEKTIVLEDDCLPDPTFFRFCEELLERFKDEERVFQIGGANFQQGNQRGDASYYFTRYNHCWGWATWRRAWRTYSEAIPDFSELPIAGRMTSSERRHWRFVLRETQRGRIDSWAYRWQVSSWVVGGISAAPQANLVANIGFDAQATHTKKTSEQQSQSVTPMDFPLRHPTRIAVNEDADAFTASLIFRAPTRFQEVKAKLLSLTR